ACTLARCASPDPGPQPVTAGSVRTRAPANASVQNRRRTFMAAQVITGPRSPVRTCPPSLQTPLPRTVPIRWPGTGGAEMMRRHAYVLGTAVGLAALASVACSAGNGQQTGSTSGGGAGQAGQGGSN